MSETVKQAFQSANSYYWYELLRQGPVPNSNTANEALTEAAIYLQHKFSSKTVKSLAEASMLTSDHLAYGPGSPARAFGYGAMRTALAVEMLAYPQPETYETSIKAVKDNTLVALRVEDLRRGRYGKGVGRVIRAAKTTLDRLNIPQEARAIDNNVRAGYAAMSEMADYIAEETDAQFNSEFREYTRYGSIGCFATYISAFEAEEIRHLVKL